MHMHTIHMDCPRCGGGFGTKGISDPICEYCGINMPLFAKARDMSNMHYNRGLELANGRNLSAAIEELTSALKINKKNIRARNLLGLCFYATGRIGEALREWVISANYGADDNVGKEYLLHFQDDIPLLERFGDALYNYNEALQFMQQYSEDLAEIRLKRAVEINPNFVDALNMLALLHIRNGERHRAGILVERVLAIDVGNSFARRYYQEVFQRKVPPAKRLRAQPAANTGNPHERQDAPQKTERQNPFSVQSARPATKATPIYGLLLFAAGLGVMFLFMYILVLPSFLEDSVAETAARSAELEYARAAHAEHASGLETQVTDLQAQLAGYQFSAAQQEEQNRNLENENLVNTAYHYLAQEFPDLALIMLDRVETARLSDDVLEIFNYVRQRAMPLVEVREFELGEIQFNTGDYDQARLTLQRAAMHSTDESTHAHYIFYLLGRIAEVQEEYNDARRYYEMIIDNFPDSNRVSAANTRLNQLP